MVRELIYGDVCVLRLGGPLVSAHLLVEPGQLTLIDTGLWGIAAELRQVLKRLGRTPAAKGLVFTGDLFASYAWSVHRPPTFLTRDHEEAEASLMKLAAARPTAILPSHYDRLEPELHAARLARLVR